jgi:predicted nucleic acid-binding protein
MMQGRVLNLDAALSLKAAEISVKHNLPMADSLIYSSARSIEATLWTQDYDFKNLEGLNLIKK